MALSATLAELETWIRQDADMQAPDDRLTSEECRNRINRSLAQLYDRLVLVDQEYFLRSATVTSNGSGKYDIMNDLQTGVVRSIQSVIAPGSGYANGATVTLSQGGNATATGIVQSAGGAITSVTLTSGGSGFSSVPVPVPTWQLQSSYEPFGRNLNGPGLVVGNFHYQASYTSTFPLNARIIKTDLTTGATTVSGPPPGLILFTLAYHPGVSKIFAVDTSGNLVEIDPVTMAMTAHPVTGIGSFADSGVFYDANTGNLFAAEAPFIYELDTSGNIISSYDTLSVFVSIFGVRNNIPGTTKIIYQAGAFSIRERSFYPPVGQQTLDIYGQQIFSAVYTPSSDRIYMAMDPAAAIKSRYYDYASATSVSIDASLATVSGYNPGLCLLTYAAATDEVVYTGSLGGVISNAVVAIESATGTVARSFQTAAETITSATIIGNTAVVAGSPAYAVTAGQSTIYLYNFVTSFLGPNYILMSVNGVGSGGQVLAYIESDFYKCKGVWFANSAGTNDNGDWSPLRRFNWEQQNALNQANLYDGYKALPLYRIVTENNSDKLLISPDNISGAYKLWYYPSPMKLMQPTDRFDGRAGWDEWIVKDVAIQVLMAEESVEQAAALKTVRDEIWQRIQLHAEDREAAAPQKIMDVTVMSRRYGPRWAR